MFMNKELLFYKTQKDKEYILQAQKNLNALLKKAESGNLSINQNNIDFLKQAQNDFINEF